MRAALPRVPASERSTFQYGVVSSASSGALVNNGHTVQLSIPAGFSPSNASVVVIGASCVLTVLRSLVAGRPASSAAR